MPILDNEALIAPIPGEAPAGKNLPFDVREKLDGYRKEVDPADYGQDDPLRPSEPKRADWASIVSLAQDTLAGTSKDLSVAARLTEALVKIHGFAGLGDGLHLMRLLVDQCWDRLVPPIEEEDDLEIRAAPFLWLDDPDRGANFPSTLHMVPIVQSGAGAYSWLDWRRSQDGRGPVGRDAFEAAIAATSRDRSEAIAADLARSREELDGLTASLNVKLGAVAPGMVGLRQALDDCRVLAGQVLERTGGSASGASTSPEGGAGQGEDAGPSARSSRAQLYRQIGEAASALKLLEPHSPIPYLLERAVELGMMPFPRLMKELVRNPDVLEGMNRELGIKEAPAEGGADGPAGGK